MPTETGRIIQRKRIALPGGGTVDVPVITQIKFLDVVDQGQESEFTVTNTGDAKRDVRTASVPGGGAAPDETGGSSNDTSQLQVERIDLWRVRDVVAQGQETFFAPDNKTFDSGAVPDFKTPYFTTHEKTHVVKYINTPDDGNWIKSELIDKWKYRDIVDQAQETEFFLSNPPDNQNITGITVGTDSDGITTTIAVDPSLPDISDSNNGVDPAWRLDPFQNIVDYSSLVPWVTARVIYQTPSSEYVSQLWPKGQASRSIPDNSFISAAQFSSFVLHWTISVGVSVDLGQDFTIKINGEAPGTDHTKNYSNNWGGAAGIVGADGTTRVTNPPNDEYGVWKWTPGAPYTHPALNNGGASGFFAGLSANYSSPGSVNTSGGIYGDPLNPFGDLFSTCDTGDAAPANNDVPPNHTFSGPKYINENWNWGNYAVTISRPGKPDLTFIPVAANQPGHAQNTIYANGDFFGLFKLSTLP